MPTPLACWSSLFYAEHVRAAYSGVEGRPQAVSEMSKDDPSWLVFDHDHIFLGAIEGEPELTWENNLAHCYAYQPIDRLFKEGDSRPVRVNNARRHAICENLTLPPHLRRRLSKEWLYWVIPASHRK